MKYYFYKYNETELEKQRAKARCLFKLVTGAEYAKDERGKPYITGSNLHVSLSHCKAGIACIVAEEPVGIDVEEISRMNLKITRRICTENELKLLENTEDKQELLCRFWVLKEAYSKLTGKGLAEKFNTIDTIKGLESGKFHAERKGGVYIGIATSSSDCRPVGFYPSLL